MKATQKVRKLGSQPVVLDRRELAQIRGGDDYANIVATPDAPVRHG